MINSILIKFHKIFVTFCAWWASLNIDFNLPYNRLFIFLDRVTIIWSGIIFTTNLVKFLTFQESSNASPLKLFVTWHSKSQSQELMEVQLCKPLDVKDVLLLNYLPCINNFGKLYYGLVSVCIGAPLFWRLYLNYFSSKGASAGGSLQPQISSHLAKQKLAEFFIEGPPKHNVLSPSIQQRQQQQVADSVKYDFKLVQQADLFGNSPNQSFRRRNLLSVMYRKRLDIVVTSDDTTTTTTTQREGADNYERYYVNPIRTYDLLHDGSERRWRFLFNYVYCIGLVIVLVSVPILWFTITALYAVIRNFTLPDNLDTNLLIGRSLKVYGVLEQIYTTTQSAMFFAFTNIFIALFHADLMYKIKPIARGLNRTYKLYLIQGLQVGHSTTKPPEPPTEASAPSAESMQKLQHLIWAYFDHLQQLDTFVSKYSFVSIITFIIGLSFGQSYLRVSENSLRMGTAAVLAANLLSFVYLYLIAWDIEQRSTRLHGTILYIVACEPDPMLKRTWQKTLFGFYASDRMRTFTLNNQFPLNLDSLFKIMFGLITMSLIANRLFHKRAWESSFKLRPDTIS